MPVTATDAAPAPTVFMMKGSSVLEAETTHNPVVMKSTLELTSLDTEVTSAKPQEPKDSIFHYMYRTNLFLLFLCFALVMTSSTLLISVVPLAADDIGISRKFATLTIGIYLFGAAVSASLSGRLFSKYGRFLGFLVGTVCTVVGAGICSLAVNRHYHFLIYVGCFLVGVQQGLGQLFRFTAVEIFPKHIQSKSVTIIISGGIVGAIMGPLLAKWSVGLVHTYYKYESCFFMLGVVGIFNLIVLLNVKFPAKTVDGYQSRDICTVEERPLFEIISQPKLSLSVTVATVANAVMVMLMSNCIIAMEDDEFGFRSIVIALQIHFLAMFVPGLFTGKLIELISAVKVAFLGCLIYVFAGLSFASGNEMWNYVPGMALLGLGWNFSFTSSTLMLTDCYRPVEALQVQAFNDFVIFSVSGEYNSRVHDMSAI
mmetsp:Transcript_22856/g.42664  ORF Transcript_22856/g.42664 Transcript_22856/m.42664 type:complete len:427 (+) Transcript_22856:162-1442(+)